MIKRTSTGLPILGTRATATAGTTQTQAGATAVTGFLNGVTTGVANDGVFLPRADMANQVGQTLIIVNRSAAILKVYPYYDATDGASGGTVDGGAANAAINQAASTTRMYTLNSKNTWVSELIS